MTRAVLDGAMTEAQLFESVRAHLKVFGWLFYHTRDSRGSNAGFPDIVAVRSLDKDRVGKLLFIELKAEKAKLTEMQWTWHEELFSVAIEGSYGCGESTRCEGLHFEVFIWRPSDLRSGEIERVLRSL